MPESSRPYSSADTEITDAHVHLVSHRGIPLMRRFLETDETFEGFCTATSRFVNGIGLDANALDNIYRRNFARLVDSTPRPVDVDLAIRQCRQVADFARGNSQQAELLDEMIAIEKALSEL